ncbi:MAG: glutamate-1-semialdehyde 2,1-aminomutase [Candidatus Omnitrophota bacterium]
MVKDKGTLTKNYSLFQEARHYLVGGVDSPVRSFNYVGGEPLLIKRGKGAYVYDYDGNRYIDYVLSWGALILGHGFASLIKDLENTLKRGLSFGTTNALEVSLAKIIQETIPFIEKIRFTNSGTEAVMGAIRLARGYTKRDKILKFTNSYHGHADYLLAKAGSGLATLSIPLSAGVPEDLVKHTVLVSFGDIKSVGKVFNKYRGEIAAVIVEPVPANFGVISPDIDFLKQLREITKKYKSLLIFDEIITGFRFDFSSAAQKFGIIPDLICLGKIIGGGLPIGAFAGKNRIMNQLAPLGRVYQASTFSGNPIVMQSGLSALQALKKLKEDYLKLERLTEYLVLRLKEEARLSQIALKINYFGTMFSFKFKHKEQFGRFYRKMLQYGIYFAPSEFESNFLSFAHTNKEIDHTINSARLTLAKMRNDD